MIGDRKGVGGGRSLSIRPPSTVMRISDEESEYWESRSRQERIEHHEWVREIRQPQQEATWLERHGYPYAWHEEERRQRARKRHLIVVQGDLVQLLERYPEDEYPWLHERKLRKEAITIPEHKKNSDSATIKLDADADLVCVRGDEAEPIPATQSTCEPVLCDEHNTGMHTPSTTETIDKSRTSRPKIKEFSRRSRKRLRHRLMAAKWNGIGPFCVYEVTLTYPDEFPKDGEEVKRHLDVFLKRLKRKYPGLAGAWKMEFQRRGAPHFHVIMVLKSHHTTGTYYTVNESNTLVPYRRAKSKGKRRIDSGKELPRGVKGVRLWVQQNWFAVVASGDIRHFNAGVEVDYVRKRHRIAHYLVSYVAKGEKYSGKEYQHRIPDEFRNWNRFWGLVNRKALIAMREVREISETEYNTFFGEMGRLLVEKGVNTEWMSKTRNPVYFNSDGDLVVPDVENGG